MFIKYAARRVLVSIPVLFGVTVVAFLLMHFAAGNFTPGIDVNPTLTSEDVTRLRANMGLDEPIYVQYWNWITGIFHGDFGRSLLDGSRVTSHILERLPNTLELTATAIAIGVIVAIPLGVTGALRRGSKLDHFLTAVSVAGISVPQFWLGLMLILFFSVKFHDWGIPFLPSSGAYAPFGGGDLLDRLAHLIMPATVLAFVYLAVWSRFVRSSTIEVMAQDYVRTARAKGMSERRVVYWHALRNSLAPLVTLIGLELPGLVAGGAIVEIVFGWPGVGRLALERALLYDFTTVMGITTFAAILVVAGNLLADILYAALDPRIRYA